MPCEKLTSIENYINNYNISFDVNDKMHSLVLPPMESFRPQDSAPAAVKTEQVVPKMEELTPPTSPACSEASSEEECVRPTPSGRSKFCNQTHYTRQIVVIFLRVYRGINHIVFFLQEAEAKASCGSLF